GCAAIATSGILKRLKFLDLALGCITDQGARVLAACPDVSRLEALDLSGNCLTAEGVEALRAVVKDVRADDQHALDDNHYLHEGEMECPRRRRSRNGRSAWCGRRTGAASASSPSLPPAGRRGTRCMRSRARSAAAASPSTASAWAPSITSASAAARTAPASVP